MTAQRRPAFAVACVEPLDRPLSADDVLAQTLSVIRGRSFGRRSTEVELIRLTLRQAGFEIVATNCGAT